MTLFKKHKSETPMERKETEKKTVQEYKDIYINLDKICEYLRKLESKRRYDRGYELDQKEDHLIDLVDEFQSSLDLKAGIKRIKRGLVIKLSCLGVVLPTVDVGSDVYLAINLFVAGHKGWAQATLFPCYVNLVFSFLEWLKYEESRKSPWKGLTLLSVFFQLYPQVRSLQVIVHGKCYKKLGGTMWKAELEEYEATTAHIEGILEGTISIFVQTAIFGCMLAYDPSHIYGLAEHNCEVHCSNPSVLIGFSSCDAMRNCSSACVDQFLSLDTNQNFEANILTMPAQTWLLDSNITRHEVMNTQAHHFFVGEIRTFVLVYVISILAASSSFMNFMRSGVVRFFNGPLGLYWKRFLFSLLTILVSFAVKIYSLMTFVSMDSTGLTNWVRGDNEQVDGRDVLQEVFYWLLIFVLPNMTFAVSSMILSQFGFLSHKIRQGSMKEMFTLILRTFANSPATIIIPAVGTITFRYKLVDTSSLNRTELKMFAISAITFKSQKVLVPRVSYCLSVVNAVITVLIAGITGIFGRAFSVTMGALFCVVFIFFWFKSVSDAGGSGKQLRKTKSLKIAKKR